MGTPHHPSHYRPSADEVAEMQRTMTNGYKGIANPELIHQAIQLAEWEAENACSLARDWRHGRGYSAAHYTPDEIRAGAVARLEKLRAMLHEQS